MKIQDEFGSPWKVSGGDPASRWVNKLVRANYQLIILPLKTLATGDIHQPAQIPEDIIQATRLSDCLAALGA